MNVPFLEESRVWLVAGHVQGVAFRTSALREAIELHLRGFIENLPDGRVHVIGVSSTDTLDRFERWLAEGPPEARVDSVVRVEDDTDYSKEVVGFVIR